VPPSPTPTPTATPTTPTPTGAEPGTSATPTPTTTTTTTAPGPAGVEVDLMVLPRTVGGDLGTELASDYGCPAPTALVPDPPRPPTGFCYPELQPALDGLISEAPRPESTGAVEQVLWAQLPMLPLFQPVTLVVSTAQADALTGVGPGPLQTGPLAGAPRWRAKTG
jgi:ABC-type transport system substrate-binding protein